MAGSVDLCRGLPLWSGSQTEAGPSLLTRPFSRRLGSEANVLREQQLGVSAAAAAHKRARDAYALSLQRTAEFRRLCSDTLWFGLSVMVAAGGHQALRRGLLAGLAAECVPLAVAARRGWGLWAAWRGAEAAACYVLAAGNALLGLAVLFTAPWLLYRTGLLSDYHTLPVTRLALGLGLACGGAGYIAVGRLGGDAPLWLAAWEAWVASHLVFSAAAHRLNRVVIEQQQAGGKAGSIYDARGGWLPAAMWAVLGLALPLTAGVLPFR